MERIKKLTFLCLQFFKFGCFTFGGGWSIVAQMQKECVERNHEITDEELLDIVSVGRSLPGTMVCNVAMLYGYRIAGYWGGMACVISMSIPQIVVLYFIVRFYSVFEQNFWVSAAVRGLTAAVVPIVISAAVKFAKGTFRYPPCVGISILSFVLFVWLGINCVYIILIGIASGIVISMLYKKAGEGYNGVP